MHMPYNLPAVRAPCMGSVFCTQALDCLPHSVPYVLHTGSFCLQATLFLGTPAALRPSGGPSRLVS